MPLPSFQPHALRHKTIIIPASSSSYSPSFSSFEISAWFDGFGGSNSMSSVDKLFLNDHTWPMKVSSHFKPPQVLAPLLDLQEEEKEDEALAQKW